MNVDPERAMSLLVSYLASSIPVAILVPALSAHSSVCPIELDFLDPGVFTQFVKRGVVSSNSICTFWCLFIVYVVITAVFVALLRDPLQKDIAARQRQIEGRAKGTTGIFAGFFMVGLFTLIPSFLPYLLPLRGRVDAYFETKSLFVLMFLLCASVWSFGFAFLHLGGVVDPDE